MEEDVVEREGAKPTAHQTGIQNQVSPTAKPSSCNVGCMILQFTDANVSQMK